MEDYAAWMKAFEDEHGFLPSEDPELRAKGLDPDQALSEHLRAKKWGEGFAQGYGRPPTHDEYRYSQPRRYENGQLVSGFGGYPPEQIERLRASWGSGGNEDDGRVSVGPRPVRFRYVAPAPQRR